MALGLAFAESYWASCYIFVLRDLHSLAHTGHEYVSFIALVGSLYVVSGGIHIGVKGEATPFKNVIFLFIGAVIANVLGTTGAAMLLIRPWIRMNSPPDHGASISSFLSLSSQMSAAVSHPSVIRRCF